MEDSSFEERKENQVQRQAETVDFRNISNTITSAKPFEVNHTIQGSSITMASQEETNMNYENGRVNPEVLKSARVTSPEKEISNQDCLCDDEIEASCSASYNQDRNMAVEIEEHKAHNITMETRFSNPCKRKRVSSTEYLDILESDLINSAGTENHEEKITYSDEKRPLGIVRDGSVQSNLSSAINSDNFCCEQQNAKSLKDDSNMGSGKEIQFGNRSDSKYMQNHNQISERGDNCVTNINSRQHEIGINVSCICASEDNSGSHQQLNGCTKGDNSKVNAHLLPNEGGDNSPKEITLNEMGCECGDNSRVCLDSACETNFYPSAKGDNSDLHSHFACEESEKHQNQHYIIHSETGERIAQEETHTSHLNSQDFSVNPSSNPSISIQFKKFSPEPSHSSDYRPATFDPCEVRNDSMFHINSLPSHLLVQIFKNLSMYHLLQHASSVCKSWYHLSHDPDLWRVIDLRNQCKVNDDVLLALCSYSDRVIYLNVSDSKLITEDCLASIVMQCPHLMTLKLTRCLMVTDKLLKVIGQSCTNLQNLSVDECYKITDEGLICVAQGCQHLTNLCLSSCRKIQADGLEAVGRFCPSLQNIQLNSCTRMQNRALLSLATGCQDLTVINLQSSDITDEGVKHLQMLTKLRFIDISVIKSLTPPTVVAIVKECKLLETLNISLNAALDDSCLQSIAQHCTKIKQLYCVACSITDKGLMELGKYCKSLTYLDIGWCQKVTCDGVLALSIGCPVLNHIGLIRCDKVSEDEMYKLVDRFPHITYSTFALESRKLIERARTEGFRFQLQEDGTNV